MLMPTLLIIRITSLNHHPFRPTRILQQLITVHITTRTHRRHSQQNQQYQHSHMSNRQVTQKYQQSNKLCNLRLLINRLLHLITRRRIRHRAATQALQANSRLSATAILRRSNLLTIHNPGMNSRFQRFKRLTHILRMMFRARRVLTTNIRLVHHVRGLRARSHNRMRLHRLRGHILTILTQRHTPTVQHHPLRLQVHNRPPLRRSTLPLIQLRIMTNYRHTHLTSLKLHILKGRDRTEFLCTSSPYRPQSPSTSIIQLSRQTTCTTPTISLSPT